jgi:hypothetical protein
MVAFEVLTAANMKMVNNSYISVNAYGISDEYVDKEVLCLIPKTKVSF